MTGLKIAGMVLGGGVASSVLLLQQTAVASGDQVIEIAKLIIPALGAYLLSRMQANKAQKAAQDTIEMRTREQLAQERAGVFDEYRALNLQSKDIVDKAYQKAAEEAAARRIAEAKIMTLESELAELKRQHGEAIEELDELRRRARQRARAKEHGDV